MGSRQRTTWRTRLPASALLAGLALGCAPGAPVAPDAGADALHAEGQRHMAGRGVPRDPQKAAALYRRAAERGHAGAQVDLGYLYESGQGVPPSAQEAVRWYERAAAQGHPIGRHNLAHLLEDGRGTERNLPRAVELYRAAAEQGMAQAQTNLGRLYQQGEGVPRDLGEAARWYERAAEQGEPAAQHNLARLLAEGRGVPQDPERALALYRAAAAQHHTPALHGIGALHARGIGVPRDPAEAARWYERAAARGDPHGRLELARLLRAGEGVPQDLPRAEALLRQLHAEDGALAPYAAFDLGSLHETERDDPATARRWYREAAEAGLPEAQGRLAGLLAAGRGGPVDQAEAGRWIERAADQGDERARELRDRLAEIERSGLGWYLDLGTAQQVARGGDAAHAAARARAIRARLASEGAGDWRLGTVDAFLAQLVEEHPEVGQGETVEGLYRRAIEGLAGAPGAVQLQRAMALRKLALHLGRQGRAEEARALTRRSHAIVRETLPPDHPLWEAGGPDQVMARGQEIGRLVAVELGISEASPP